MPINTETYSRFFDTECVEFDGQATFGKWNIPDIVNRNLLDTQITRYTVPKALEGRPDRISFQFYGTTKLDWFIIARNKANVVFNWPRAGETIDIPSSSIVSAELV